MTWQGKLRIVLLLSSALLAGWQFQQHWRLGQEFQAVETQLRDRDREFEPQRTQLAALEKKNDELVEAERRAGNQALLALMRERSAITMSNSQEAEAHSLGGVLAKVLDNPDQQEIDREATRNQMKASMGVFFNLIHLSPEGIDRYIDLQIEMDKRNADRTSALLRGQMTVADALQQRDNDLREQETRRAGILGAEGEAFLESIGNGTRNDEATGLVNLIQQNLNDNALNLDQSNRLQRLVKAELDDLKLDDTDLFRTPDDWVQFVGGHQQNVLNQAAAFLTPAQWDGLKNLAALDMAQKKEAMMLKRKSLGIK